MAGSEGRTDASRDNRAVAGGRGGQQADINGNIWWYDNIYDKGYISGTETFACPSVAPRFFDRGTNNYAAYGSIIDDLEYHTEFPGDRRLYNLSRLSEPSNQPIILDSCRGEVMGATPGYGGPILPGTSSGSMEMVRIWHRGSLETHSGHLRHARRANTIYADGHVEIADQDRLYEGGFRGSYVGYDGPESYVWVPFFGP